MANIIKAKHEILNQGGNEGATKHIEKIGRVCYKSEEKICDGSDVKFVNMLCSRQHTAMLEHSNFVFEVSHDLYKKIKDYRDERGNTFFKMTEIDSTTHPLFRKGRYLVSASVRTINNSGFGELIDILKEINPALVYNDSLDYFVPGDKYCAELVKDVAELPYVTREEIMTHTYISIKFTCDRGVTHELVRHRPVAFAQESTRYCNYAGDKFGNEITVIDIEEGLKLNKTVVAGLADGTITMNDIESFIAEWKSAIEDAEKHYMRLLEIIKIPEMARSVLPNSTKAEIIMTANLAEWIWIDGLRTAPAAHPQMREVMIPAINEIKQTYGQYFEK